MASGDAGGRAGAWRGRVAPGQVACGVWQVEDEPGRRGSEQNQGRAAHLAVPWAVFCRRSTDGVRGERGAGSGSLVNNPKFKTQFCNFNFSPSYWLQMKNF